MPGMPDDSPSAAGPSAGARRAPLTGRFAPFPGGEIAGIVFSAVVAAAAFGLLAGLPPDARGEWGAWLLAGCAVSVLLLLASLRGLGDIWRWLVFRPDPPRTGAEWLRSLVEHGAWLPTLLGSCCLVPGLVLTVAAGAAPWWRWWQAQSFEPVPCTVVEGPVYRGGGGRFWSQAYDWMALALEYRVHGERHVSTSHSPWRLGRTEWLLDPPRFVEQGRVVERGTEWALGTRHTCWVSMDDPRVAYAVRGRAGLLAEAFTAVGPLLVLLGGLIVASRVNRHRG